LRTLVYLDFKPLPGNKTELTLRNFGYGDGDDWAKNKAYFAAAWPAVMANLEKRFVSGRFCGVRGSCETIGSQSGHPCLQPA